MDERDKNNLKCIKDTTAPSCDNLKLAINPDTGGYYC